MCVELGNITAVDEDKTVMDIPPPVPDFSGDNDDDDEFDWEVHAKYAEEYLGNAIMWDNARGYLKDNDLIESETHCKYAH